MPNYTVRFPLQAMARSNAEHCSGVPSHNGGSNEDVSMKGTYAFILVQRLKYC